MTFWRLNFYRWDGSLLHAVQLSWGICSSWYESRSHRVRWLAGQRPSKTKRTTIGSFFPRKSSHKIEYVQPISQDWSGQLISTIPMEFFGVTVEYSSRKFRGIQSRGWWQWWGSDNDSEMFKGSKSCDLWSIISIFLFFIPANDFDIMHIFISTA